MPPSSNKLTDPSDIRHSPRLKEQKEKEEARAAAAAKTGDPKSPATTPGTVPPKALPKGTKPPAVPSVPETQSQVPGVITTDLEPIKPIAKSNSSATFTQEFGYTEESFRLSKITLEQVVDMGLKSGIPYANSKYTATIEDDSFLENVDSFKPKGTSALKVILDRLEGYNLKKSYEKIEVLNNTVSLHTEAAARMYIDQFLLVLLRLQHLEDQDKRPDKAHILQLYTELILANKLVGIPFAGVNEKTMYFVTGKTDYVMCSVDRTAKQPGEKAIPPPSAIELKKNTDGMLKLTEWVELYPAANKFPSVTDMLVIEAKSVRNSIQSHHRQVHAEAITALSQTGLSEIRYCLTTGHKWVFGLMKRTRRPPIQEDGKPAPSQYSHTYECFESRELDLTKDNFKSILKALIIWTCGSSAITHDMLASDHEVLTPREWRTKLMEKAKAWTARQDILDVALDTEQDAEKSEVDEAQSTEVGDEEEADDKPDAGDEEEDTEESEGGEGGF
ncbi:hypothetical protein ONZ45_g4159 [Pleurotus djamor]|nr:hypothetical protein ONZ45_g4159 [Pleurotus djamor]